MHALVRFSHIAAGDTFTTTEIHSDTANALDCSTAEYSLGSLRYDVSKLRAKSLVQRLPKSRRYRLTKEGYQVCVVYLKLFEKLYAPLTSAILSPFPADKRLDGRLSQLDRLYAAASTALAELVNAVGLKAA
jgi:hypothetical protein